MDEFYMTLVSRKMTTVFRFSASSGFHKKIVEYFDLESKIGATVNTSNCYTIWQGIFIDGKPHGTAKIVVFKGHDMELLLLGNFKKGELHGNCSFATRKKIWSRVWFEKGVKAGLESEICF